MKEEEEAAHRQTPTPQHTHYLWIDQNRKVLSFHREDGSHRLGFYSLDSMMAYVMEQVSSGYRIQ